jgi:NADH-quinone oxidoreductase subunit L
MFHLITHAFFKALLFLGAGLVIHGCHEEQDIRRMGGLRRWMPVTFATYAVGMLALAGFPLVFSGFWSKDEILHAAHGWPVSKVPLYLGLVGALLTAFYMTRQVCHVFFGEWRGGNGRTAGAATPHESPPVMTVPLAVLAGFAVLLGFLGTPAWPWFQAFLTGEELAFKPSKLFAWEHLSLLLASSCLALGGMALGWWLYGRRPLDSAESPDALAMRWPAVYRVLAGKFFVDELYEATVVRWHAGWARVCDLLDRWLWGGAVLALQGIAWGLSWVSKVLDEFGINLGFDLVCGRVRRAAGLTATLQDGRLPNYLRALALALALLLLLLTWGVKG